MDDREQSVQHFLDLIKRSQRGKFKVYIGMIAGVGKSYRMLQEAHELLENGVDVKIGYIETHGRVGTEGMLQGLPVIPRRKIFYKGKELEEMDLDSIIRLHPEIVIVDELAHTNVEGSLNEKRWQDVMTLLDEGINVISAINIQHIESVNEEVQEITGIEVKERVPDSVLQEAYDMKDGTPFVWNNQSNPYDNRDPRMKYTIVCNEMKWPVDPVEIWEGGTNGLPLQNATTTGYYLKKYVNNTISFEAGSTVTKKQHNWVLFRYGEILLNYAEAMINAFHDPNYKDAVYNMSAREAVNQIRGRTNISLPGFPSDITEKDFVKRLKNERRVELAFEGHRFWDVRRWKELGQTANIYGVKITKNNEVISYEKFLLETRAVTDNMYFYPIPNTERFKNPNLGQNPGW